MNINIEDSEVLDLATKVVLTFSLLIIGIFFFTLILSRKNSINPTYLENKIDGKDDFVLLVRDKDCKNCKEITDLLKRREIKYYTLNVDKNRRSDLIIDKLDIPKSDIVEPTLINIKEGKVYSILIDIKKMDDLNGFIEYNNLANMG